MVFFGWVGEGVFFAGVLRFPVPAISPPASSELSELFLRLQQQELSLPSEATAVKKSILPNYRARCEGREFESESEFWDTAILKSIEYGFT